MIWKVSKEFRFEAAHSLPQLPEGHKCQRPHGHSYRVEVVIAAAQLDARGFAGVDYAELDAFGDYLAETFDHRNLNEVMGGGENTTAERLAEHFFLWCHARWPNLWAVRVYETARTCVEVTES